MTGLHVLHAHDSDNVAGLCAVQFVTVVGVHLNHTADPLGFTGERVEDGVALVQVRLSRCVQRSERQNGRP